MSARYGAWSYPLWLFPYRLFRLVSFQLLNELWKARILSLKLIWKSRYPFRDCDRNRGLIYTLIRKRSGKSGKTCFVEIATESYQCLETTRVSRRIVSAECFLNTFLLSGSFSEDWSSRCRMWNCLRWRWSLWGCSERIFLEDCTVFSVQ